MKLMSTALAQACPGQQDGEEIEIEIQRRNVDMQPHH